MKIRKIMAVKLNDIIKQKSLMNPMDIVVNSH